MGNAPLAQALRGATARLESAGVPSPQVDARALAAHLMGVDRGEVEAAAVRGVEAPSGFEDLIEQRAMRVPLQYLTGVAFFRHCTLQVGPGVFIPRPETELVAERAIGVARCLQAPVVVDLGTGSGALAAAVGTEVSGARVHAIELSPRAHAWAQLNLEPLGVQLHMGDMRDAWPELEGVVDIVMTNPPYIPPEAVPQQQEVADYDPPGALYGGGVDGLELPRAAIAAASRLLRPGGYFVMEHGSEQMSSILAALAQWGFTDIEGHSDLAGCPRFSSGYRPDEGESSQLLPVPASSVTIL